MKELEDYNWFPQILRKFQLEFIGHFAVAIAIYKPLKKIVLTIPNINKWVDLCTGASLPAIALHKSSTFNLPLVFTDKFPIYKHVNYEDVLETNFETNTLYTMFNSWHHFTIKEQTLIVNKLTRTNTPFILAEILQPNILSLIKVIVAATLGQLVFTPFIKPFSFNRLVFTYIIPINIITVLFDGIVSVFKSVHIKNVQKFARENSTPNYNINCLILRSSFFNNIYVLKGTPIA